MNTANRPKLKGYFTEDQDVIYAARSMTIEQLKAYVESKLAKIQERTANMKARNAAK